MKHIMESAETFEAYSIIDLCYYSLKQLNKEVGKPKDVVNIMIDKATGFSEHQNKKWIESSIELIKEIIKNKKFLEADYSNDAKILAELEALEEKNKATAES